MTQRLSITTMTLKFSALLMMLALMPLFAFADTAMPSTNDQNRTNGWAHVDQLSESVGETELKFISTRAFVSCFEYRVDNEANTVAGNNPNPAVTDGRWTQVCVNNSYTTRTIEADEFVDVRMVYGAESDERFDWTRFDILPEPKPITKNDCKAGEWSDLGFKNQGQCIKFVNTGKDSR